MAYETSYDAGLKPFNHDKHRGKWSSPTDFLYACIGHAFKVDTIFVLPAVLFRELGIYVLVPYFIVLATCVVPIVFMQSFLGQFSSTGFISSLRIAPLFKGIGFVALAVNIISLTYYSIFAAIPLFYFFHSLKPTIPWSCEGAKEWMEPFDNMSALCNQNDSIHIFALKRAPSLTFFQVHLNTLDFYGTQSPEVMFSWSLMICSFLIWIVVGAVLSQRIQVIARFIRYTCWIVIGIMGICVVRFAFLPNALSGLKDFVDPLRVRLSSFALIPFLALATLGPGWSSILTMASYNSFKTNILRYSWLVCLAQFGIMFGLSLMSLFISGFLKQFGTYKFWIPNIHAQWMEFLVTPTALLFLEMPHFWLLLFFGMMTAGLLNLLVVQLFSLLTSLFDEYEKLRSMKMEVTFGAVGTFALASIYFCSNHGITFFEHIMRFGIITQMFLNLLLLLVVLWVYGRVRFERDLNFMTNRRYPAWMMTIVRFVAPIFLICGMILSLILSVQIGYKSLILVAFVGVIALLPWCIIPGYCIFKVLQTSGTVNMRIRRCVRPTDWYPVDPEDRQRYDETFSNSDVSHQLTTENVV